MVKQKGQKGVVTTSSTTEEAKALIFDMLRNGPRPAVDIFEEAQRRGIGSATLKKAKLGLAASSKTKLGWVWELLHPLDAQAAEG